MLIIDAHAHIYAEDDVQHPPIDNPIRPSGASGSVRTLEALAAKNHVAGLCIVQTISFYGWDNRFLCDVSRACPKRMAGVCSLDPDDPNSPDLLHEYVTDYGVRGVRCFPGSDGHLDHPGVHELWTQAAQLGITVNVSVGRESTDDLVRMLERFDRLPVVIDNCLIQKPSPDVSTAVADMIRLARFPNAFAKVNFIPLGSLEEYPHRDMHEPCKRIIAAYGPDRCVWGNSYPCELWTPRSSYSQNLRLFTHELGLESPAKETILGHTANRLWFLDKLPRPSDSRRKASHWKPAPHWEPYGIEEPGRQSSAKSIS